MTHTEGTCPAPPGLYGLLEVAGITLAIAAGAIREVVPRPAQLMPFPLTRPDLAGAMALRGAIIPLVDMGLLLGQGPAQTTNGIVAILRHEDRVAGVLLDAIQGIARLEAEAIGALHYADDAPLQRLAAAGFLHADARGVVIDVAHLAQMPGLPFVPDSLAGRRLDHIGSASAGAPAKRHSCLVFRAGGQVLALEAGAIVATLPETALSAPPVDNELWLGTLAWNGAAVPAVDTLRLIGAGRIGACPARSQAVVVHIGEGRVALLIDAVDDIRQLPRQGGADLARIGVTGPGAAHALVDLDGQPLLHLDAAALAADPRLAEVAAMQMPLGEVSGPSTAPGTETGPPQDGARSREAWLTFRLGPARYALPLASVEAVLPGNQPLLPIPGQFPLVGAFLHRERPTPVIDLATRLGNTLAQAQDAAILVVVGMNGRRLAFLADMLCSVERVPLQPLRTLQASRQLPGATIRCREALTWEVLGAEAFALPQTA